MPPCIQIIERIENEVETLEEFHVEPRVLDVCMMRLELDVRIEFLRAFFRNLNVNCSASNALREAPGLQMPWTSLYVRNEREIAD